MKQTKIITVLVSAVILLVFATRGYTQKDEGQTTTSFYSQQARELLTQTFSIYLNVTVEQVNIESMKRNSTDTSLMTKIKINLKQHIEQLKILDIALKLLYVAIENTDMGNRELYMEEITKKRLLIAPLL